MSMTVYETDVTLLFWFFFLFLCRDSIVIFNIFWWGGEGEWRKSGRVVGNVCERRGQNEEGKNKGGGR